MENGLVNLINRIPADRYRHCVLCVEDYSDFRDRITRPDVDVVALHRSQVGTVGLYRAFYREFRARRPAILHSRNMSGLDALLPGKLAGVRHRIHGEHGWDVNDLTGTNRKFQRLRRFHTALVERYVTVSRDLERYLIERVRVAPSRICQIYNGVDTDRFRPAPNRQRQLLPVAHRGDGLFIIGTVGRLQPVKDQATLVRAFAVLRRLRPEAAARLRLVLVGDGIARQALVDLAAAEGIAETTWFAGAQADTRPHYAAFDVFVLPSLMEGISNTILEAMSSGLPVVASAVGGNLELVKDGVNGFLIPPADPPQFAVALARYLDNTALLRNHGEASRRHAVESFGLEAMIGAYTALYDAMLFNTR
jgi:sugar transferase (PEP-CTERM/EpsH1 system associated)